MKSSQLFRIISTTTFGIIVGMMASTAPAQDSVDPNDPCVASCREATHDCRFDAREAIKLCLEEEGCDVLRDDYRDVCLSADRDKEVCSAARTELRECVGPCRDALRDNGQVCRESGRTCLTDECGIENTRPPRKGRFAREGNRRPPRSDRRPNRGN